MFRVAILTIVLALATATAALAQTLPPQPPPVANLMGQGTDEEHAACHPDVMRYCKQLVTDDQSDVFAILDCLQTNRPKISSACRQVLASHGQ